MHSFACDWSSMYTRNSINKMMVSNLFFISYWSYKSFLCNFWCYFKSFNYIQTNFIKIFLDKEVDGLKWSHISYLFKIDDDTSLLSDYSTNVSDSLKEFLQVDQKKIRRAKFDLYNVAWNHGYLPESCRYKFSKIVFVFSLEDFIESLFAVVNCLIILFFSLCL